MPISLTFLFPPTVFGHGNFETIRCEEESCYRQEGAVISEEVIPQVDRQEIQAKKGHRHDQRWAARSRQEDDGEKDSEEGSHEEGSHEEGRYARDEEVQQEDVEMNSSATTEQADGICLPDAWAYFSDHSGRASDVNRQLAFAAIAIVWVFRGAEGGPLSIPNQLLWAGLFSSLALAADLVHYLVAAICWGTYARHLEKKHYRTDQRFKAPTWLNTPAWIFFAGKIVAVAIAYGFIAVFMVRAVMSPS